MKYHSPLSALFALAVLPLSVQANFDLNDLVPATSEQGQALVSNELEPVDGVIFADSEPQAVATAHQMLLQEQADGIQMISVGSGIGILSIGSADYKAFDNRNATLLSKRKAYIQAFEIAKKQFVENMQGMNNACTTAISESVDVIDTATESVANVTSDMVDACLESVQGSLAGYVTFDVFDDMDAQRVSVSLISTPKTRQQTKRQLGCLTVSTDPNEIFKHIIDDLQSGVMPPVGAKVITHPETNETYVLGFGSSIIRHNRNKTVQRKLEGAAINQSQAKARSALLATMQGEEIYWQGGFSETLQEANEQFEYVPEAPGPDNVVVLEQDRSTFVNQLKMTDSYKSISAGQLPAGVSTKSFQSHDGDWMLTVAVYSPSLEAVAVKARQENDQRTATHSPSSSKHKLSVHGGESEQNNSSQGPSGQVSSANDL
ncbi:hypothetical protein [Aliagarivorans marinus]|uniref:hypothetical protein n=1 Tax=Aliagarivorans marinus TaxID=561965 RepID=UPI0004147C16|nr:hypothetical protein [Aliagarivorans marinus]